MEHVGSNDGLRLLLIYVLWNPLPKSFKGMYRECIVIKNPNFLGANGSVLVWGYINI